MKPETHPFVDAFPLMAASMSPQSRLEFAIMAIKACELDDRAELVAAIAPTVPDDVWDGRSEAKVAEDFFALATEKTVKIYAAAAWKAMGKVARAGFVDWMQTQVKPPSLPKAAQEPPL